MLAYILLHPIFWRILSTNIPGKSTYIVKTLLGNKPNSDSNSVSTQQATCCLHRSPPRKNISPSSDSQFNLMSEGGGLLCPPGLVLERKCEANLPCALVACPVHMTSASINTKVSSFVLYK